MDDADMAEERERIAREAAIRRASSVLPLRPQPNGHCHACDELVELPRLFCGPDCAEHWELQRRRS